MDLLKVHGDFKWLADRPPDPSGSAVTEDLGLASDMENPRANCGEEQSQRHISQRF